MSAITQSYKIDMTSGAVPLRIKVSQYDAGIRQLTFWLYNLGTKLTSSQLSSLTAYVQGTKEDQKGFEYECTAGFSSEGCYVDVEITEQMTACAGDVICELVLIAEDVRIGSANFVLEVEKAALGADTDISETELPDIIDAGRRYAEQAEDAAERAEEAAAGVDNYALAGAGKMTGYSDGVINTNVYLHREPKVGDRLLIRMTQTFTDSTPIKIYKESGGTAYTLSFDMWSDQYKLEGLCLVEIVEFLQNLALRFLYSFNGASLSAGQYIGITGGGYINNTAPQLGDNSDYIEITNAADGDLGAWNYYARYALVNFKVNAAPYSATGEYVIKLARGSVLEDASLVDRDGNDYIKPIKAGTVLLCVINAGTDTVTVVNDDIIANGRVLDGNGNDLQSVAALELSASGNPIVVNAQGIDAKELSVELEPSQDLHGYDKPWVGGAGKNKLDVSNMSTASENGLTFSKTSEGVISVNGTATDNVYRLVGTIQTENGVSYTLNGCPSGGSNTTYRLTVLGLGYDTGSGYTFTGDGNTHNITIDIKSGYACPSGGLIFKPMVRLSTESDASFAPWENICPISGRTEARVDRSGKNLFDKNQTGMENAYLSADGVFHNAETWRTTNYQIITGGNYRMSGAIRGGYYCACWYDGAKNYIGGSQTASITVPNDAVYVRYSVHAMDMDSFQFEQGATATDYEPYKGINVTIQLGQTVYGARINFKTGEGTLVDIRPEYDGSEAWSISNHRFAIALSPDSVNTPSEITCKCNMFAPKTASDLWSNRSTADYVGVTTQGSNAYVVDNVHYTNYDDTDLAAFKTALSTNKLQIAYKLATPIPIQLTPSMLKLLEGYNYITGDGEMSMVYIPESVLDEAQANAKAYTDNKVPDAPTTDGTYRLTCTVTDGVPAFSWESAT